MKKFLLSLLTIAFAFSAHAVEKQVTSPDGKLVVTVSDENGVKLGADASAFAVKAEVVAQDKFKKVVVFKYKAKKNERKKQGHRQPFTAVKIESISAK